MLKTSSGWFFSPRSLWVCLPQPPGLCSLHAIHACAHDVPDGELELHHVFCLGRFTSLFTIRLGPTSLQKCVKIISCKTFGRFCRRFSCRIFGLFCTNVWGFPKGGLNEGWKSQLFLKSTPFYRDSLENRQFGGQKSKSSRGKFWGESPPP